MSIAEEIYQQVQQLPESAAREVLAFVDYLKKRDGLPDDAIPDRKGKSFECLYSANEKLNDEIWNELLFGQSDFAAVTSKKPAS